MPPDEPRKTEGSTEDTKGSPQFLSTRAIQEHDDKPEVLDKASELLKPLLRDPTQAPQAAAKLVAVMEHHRGPLPHPRTLGGYEDIIPGAAREILEMAKSEQRHRHKMENMEIFYPYVTLSFGGFALLSCIAGAVFLAYSIGNTKVAIALLSAPLIGAVGWLINSRIKSSKTNSPTPAVVRQSSKKSQGKRR